ncbi:signal peptidase I [Rhodococcus sp. WMMA185]|nr:signal peptidase I [Rhodococcus sp. WMMA185]
MGAIAGLICVLAASASFFFGIKPLVFRSGSMSPDIPTGSLALSRAVPASDLAVGDVVSVLNEQGTRITHRVEEIVSSNANSSVLILKGDANKDADLSPYTVSEADRVFFSVPSLGYVVAWLSSPVAIFLGGAFVGSLMVVAFRPVARKDDDDPSGEGSGGAKSAEAESTSESESVGHGDVDDAPTQQLDMPVAPVTKTRTLATRLVPSRSLPARPLMALGAVGLSALVATTSGTAAAFTDTASAASSFGAISNFYPTPVVEDTSCRDVGNFFDWDAIVSWDSLGKTPLGDDYEYEVLVRRSSNKNHVYLRKNVGTDTEIRLDINDTARLTYVEIHTVNGPNKSTGYRGQKVYAETVTRTYCDGGEVYSANPDSENVQGLAAPQGLATKSLSMASVDEASDRLEDESTTEASTTTTEAPETTTDAAETTTEAPETTTDAAETTTEAPETTTDAAETTTEAPETTTDAAETTTEAPETTTDAAETTTETPETTTETPETTEVEPVEDSPTSGGSAITNLSASGDFAAEVSSSEVVITDADGVELSSISVGKKAMVQWEKDSDELWIIDSDEVLLVGKSGGWKESEVDPESDEIPDYVAELFR